jgi:hypothetical protein
MNEQKLFDLAVAVSQEEGAKIGGKTLSTKQAETAFTKCIQAFMHAPVQKEKDSDRKIQAFGSSADLAVVAKDVFNVTTEVTNYDLLWDEAFRSISLSKGQLSWEIHTAAVGTAFKEIPEGGKIKYEGLQSSKETVYIKKYGAGLGITWETIEGRKVYRFIELMEDARSKLYNTWADVHYGLLATAGATNTVAWQGAGTDSTLDRDIATLNKGYEDISDDNKDSGYGDTANARYVLYTRPTLRGRINRALRATSAEVASQGGTKGQVVDANIEPRYSWNSNIAANKALLVLPGKKIQNSVYLKNLVLEKTEQESLNKLKTYWTAFGAAIGDNDQVYELAFA